MMNYDEFKAYVVDNIKSFLPSEYENASVTLNIVTKNSDVELSGINIRKGKNIYGSIESKVSARDLKDKFDRMRGAFKEQNEVKEEKPSITEKIAGFQKEIEDKEKEKPKALAKKKEEVAI